MVKVSRLPVPRRRAHEARGHAERPQQVDVQQRDARARGVAEDQRAHRVVDQRRLLRPEDDRRGAREATEQRPRLLVDERRDVRQRARVAQAHDQRRELAPQQLPPVRARLVDGGKRQHRVLPHLARDACGPAKALARGEAQADSRLDDAAIEERLHVGQIERRQVGPEELGRRRCRLLGGLARLARPRHRPGRARRRWVCGRRWREGGVGDEQHFVRLRRRSRRHPPFGGSPLQQVLAELCGATKKTAGGGCHLTARRGCISAHVGKLGVD